MTKPKEKSTMVELVTELEALRTTAGGLPADKLTFLDETIAEAKAGEYHDFKNEKYACGKVEVVGRLRKLGAGELALRVIDGEFDESPDEDDKQAMREFAPRNMWPMLGLEPKANS